MWMFLLSVMAFLYEPQYPKWYKNMNFHSVVILSKTFTEKCIKRASCTVSLLVIAS